MDNPNQSRFDEDAELMRQAIRGGLLTKIERIANRQFLISAKLECMNSASMREMLEQQKTTPSKEIDALMEGGYEKFRMRVCERLRNADWH